MKQEKADFWHKVFARILHKNITNETFNLSYPSVMVKFERYCGCVMKRVERSLKSEDEAYDFFAELFTRLNPNEQKALTGKTADKWLEIERVYRELN